MYERAAGLYAESGLPNNAIALCNKILRNAPGRTKVYLKLAQLMVLRGFVAEAKQNLLEYAERMQRAGKLEEAFEALKEFADLSPANEEIRLLLAEQLKAAARSDEAREQLDKLYSELQATGDTRRSRLTLEKIRAIDPEYDLEGAAPAPVPTRKGKTSDLVFLDLDDERALVEEGGVEELLSPVDDTTLDIQRTQLDDLTVDEADDEAGLIEIERTSVELDLTSRDSGSVEGLEISRWDSEPEVMDVPPLDVEHATFDQPASLLDDEEALQSLLEEDVEEDVELPLMEVSLEADEETEVELPLVDVGLEAEEEAVELPMLDVADELVESAAESAGLELEVGGAIEAPELDLGETEAEEVELEVEAAEDEPVVAAVELGATEAVAPPDVATLESRVADDPDDPVLHRELGEALLEEGERERGLEELDLALQLHETRDEWLQAGALVDELLRLDPNSARHHQKRVELAFRSGDKRTLVDAYLGLADALVRTDEIDRARLVYHRVLEHDSDNESALAHLETLKPVEEEAAPAPAAAAPTPEPQPADASYVDLGALLFEESVDRDTRMRIEEEEPTGDEQKDFERMLSRFKRGIEANIEEEDAQAHYDLGIAFKEMGLLDEAISEFQKALRAPDARLPTSEALGLCFYEKGQYSVAATVLRRAIETEPGGDDQKIGLLYWLGRCDEELEKRADALQHYQRVFAIDINFGDVSDRVRTLAGAGS
jgi:tetratricopeptide (TPR) repeat protein